MKNAVVLFILFCLATGINAQTYTIAGKVTDSATGEALVGASVVIGQTVGAATDLEGNYSIKNLKAGDYEIKCAYAGYTTHVKTITLSGKTLSVKLNFQMNEATIQASEVLVQAPVRRMEVKAMMVAPSNYVNTYPPQMGGGRNTLHRERKAEEYTLFSENGFISPADKPLSTFSVDVDRASYSLVRGYITDDEELPPADAVRIEEMINYFHYSYPEPTGGDAVSITTQLTRCPWNNNNLLLRIGLKSPGIDLEKAPANNLVFLVDVSGSMQDEDKLPWVKQSLAMLVEQLREQDQIALVVYAGNSGLVLPSTPGNNKAKILEAINRLEAGGSTAGAAGIQLAYQVAAKNFIKEGNNRVILCTDGDFNVGVTNNGELERLIAEKSKTGTYLTVLGFGIGNYKDNRMEMLADKGNGNYGYIDNLNEAKKLLVKEMGATLHTVAQDVKLQLEFNPLLVQQYRLIGYENRLLKDEEFNMDSVDAGDMGAGHTVTALYEVVPGKAMRANIDSFKYQQTSVSAIAANTNELLTVKFRYKTPGKKKSKLLAHTVNNLPVGFESASTDTRFAATVAAFGMLLRKSEYKGNLTFASVLAMAEEATKNATDEEKQEFVQLVKTAKELYDEYEEDAYAENKEE